MDDMLLTPQVQSGTMTDTGYFNVFQTRNTKVIKWVGTSQTLKAYGTAASATPLRFALSPRQVSAVYPSPLYVLRSPVSILGGNTGYQPGGSQITYWPVVAVRVVTEPTWGSNLWSGGETDYLEVNATAMRDHMNMPCTFEMDAETLAEIPSWAYDIQPTHHGFQGIYSADISGITENSLLVDQCVHNTKTPHGDYRSITGLSNAKLLHHIPSNDLLAGIGIENPLYTGGGTLLCHANFHRAPITFRYRRWAMRQVATGAGDPGPPTDDRIGYYFYGAAYSQPLQYVYAPFTRSGGVITIGSYDYYGYVADLTIDPAALSPPSGTLGFYLYDITSSASGRSIIERKLSLNFPYCASPGIITPSVYFPGRGIKIGNISVV